MTELLVAMLTVEEVAKVTRAPINTVRRWQYSGKLPTVNAGRRRLVRVRDLAAFLGVEPSEIVAGAGAT